MNMKIKSRWNDTVVSLPAKIAPVLVAWTAYSNIDDGIHSRGVCIATFDGIWKGLPVIKDCAVFADFWAPLALHPQDFGA